jgi:hypothetical protein
LNALGDGTPSGKEARARSKEDENPEKPLLVSSRPVESRMRLPISRKFTRFVGTLAMFLMEIDKADQNDTRCVLF